MVTTRSLGGIEVWWDAESYNGKGWKSEYSGDDGTAMHLGPQDKRPVPCLDCSNNEICMSTAVACKAFRSYCDSGNYSDMDVLIKLKSI